MLTSEIHIRDPFVVPDPSTKSYFLTGTTGHATWGGPGPGFDVYRSTDLETWDGPIPCFRPGHDFWATRNFWAPEIHRYGGRTYLLASFKADRCYRGTQILAAEEPVGPFSTLTEGPITPADWECLDGTLHIDAGGAPWIVFCHEWVQIHNGAIVALPLTPDLKRAAGRPIHLFNASEAPWVRPIRGWPAEGSGFPCYVTDGPYLYRTRADVLLMLWSSFGDGGYTLGVARSASGTVTGPWVQEPEPLWTRDGGHGMVFRTFEDRLMLTFHQPNETPLERPVFIEIEDTGSGLQVKA